MRKISVFLCLIFALFWGLKTGKKLPIESSPLLDSRIEFPLKERKTFVFIVYAYNQAEWVERSLRSIFEQEYDYYRIVFIDDGSKDFTFETAQSFVAENNQEEKTLFVHNEEKLGMIPCLHKVIQGLLDQEIAIPLLAKNWLSHDGALTRMNEIYQNPDVWLASSSGIEFPSYAMQPSGIDSFYAVLFKQLPQKQGKESTYVPSLKELAQGKIRHVSDVLLFNNNTLP